MFTSRLLGGNFNKLLNDMQDMSEKKSLLTL